MADTLLRFRSDGRVVAGLFLGPAVSLGLIWLCMIFGSQDFSFSHPPLLRALFLLPWLLMIGGGWAFVVELAVVLPLMAAYQRHRWRWLSAWSASAIGLVMGALPFAIVGLAAILSSSPAKGTWADVAGGSMAGGIAGVVAALVIYLVAVERVPVGSEPSANAEPPLVA